MNFKFLAPVYIGDTITAHGEITSIDRVRCRVTFHMRCFKEDGTCVLEGDCIGIPTQVEI